MGALNSPCSPRCLPVFSWGRGGDSGPGCCWEREHGGAAFPAPVLSSPTKLPPHPDRNRSPHSTLRAQSSQHTAPGLIPTPPPCLPAQRSLLSSVSPAPQLLPSPGTRPGLRLPGAGSGLPKWQLQEGSTGTLNQGGFPRWCWQPWRMRAPAASSAHSSLLYLPAPSSPRPTAPTASLVSRAGSGTGPFLTSQANKAADPLHFPSSAVESPPFPHPQVS